MRLTEIGLILGVGVAALKTGQLLLHVTPRLLSHAQGSQIHETRDQQLVALLRARRLPTLQQQTVLLDQQTVLRLTRSLQHYHARVQTAAVQRVHHASQRRRVLVGIPAIAPVHQFLLELQLRLQLLAHSPRAAQLPPQSRRRAVQFAARLVRLAQLLRARRAATLVRGAPSFQTRDLLLQSRDFRLQRRHAAEPYFVHHLFHYGPYVRLRPCS